MQGSYAARRSYLDEMFEPVEYSLSSRVTESADQNLIDPFSEEFAPTWSIVHAEMDELRRRFASARTEQDYCSIGAACVRILEHLGEVAFDAAVHLREGMPPPPRDKTKLRFDLVIEHAAGGPDHEVVRKTARAVVELAHEVKHRRTPTRRDAGIASDAVIMLVSLLRRLTDVDS